MHLHTNPVFTGLPEWLRATPSLWVAVAAFLAWLRHLYEQAVQHLDSDGDHRWAQWTVYQIVAYVVAIAINGAYALATFAAANSTTPWGLPAWPLWLAVGLLVAAGGSSVYIVWYDVTDQFSGEGYFNTLSAGLILNVVAAAYVATEMASYALPYGNSNAAWLATADNWMMYALQLTTLAFLLYAGRESVRRHRKSPLHAVED